MADITPDYTRLAWRFALVTDPSPPMLALGDLNRTLVFVTLRKDLLRNASGRSGWPELISLAPERSVRKSPQPIAAVTEVWINKAQQTPENKSVTYVF